VNDVPEEIKASWAASGNFPCAGKWADWYTIITAASLKPTLKEAALYLGANGFPICTADPVSGNLLNIYGVWSATTDRETIEQLWTAQPDAAVALPTGAKTGVFAIRVSPAALMEWVALKQKYNDDSSTLALKAPDGSEIHLYRYPYLRMANSKENLRGTDFPKGISLLDHGWSVILPPSPGAEVLHGPSPAEAPGWLLDKVAPQAKPKKDKGKTKEAERKRAEAAAATLQLLINSEHVSERLMAVAALIRQGKTNEEISAALKGSIPIEDIEEVRNRTAVGGAADSPFSMTSKALWFSDDAGWVRLSQSFEILGFCRDTPNARGQTDNWGLLLRFSNRDGKERDVIVGAADLHGDVGPLCANLAAKGMDIERGDNQRKLFVRYLCQIAIDDRVSYAGRLGWNRHGKRSYTITKSILKDGDTTDG
jgi:hypothetical protein